MIDASDVDTTTVGNYTVTYNVTDSTGNAAAEVIRSVNVVDTTAPVITLNGAASITLEVGVDTYTELGATVSDDGAPTLVEATVGGDTVDTTTVGTYVVTYDANDGYNDAIQVTRTVTVSDNTAPVITLNGAASITLEVGVDTYTELGATVSDDGAPTLVEATVGGDTVDTTTVGTYVVTYDANDGYNDAIQVTRTVTVSDTIAPVITLNGAASITLEVGVDTYTELGATVSDDGLPTLTAATVGGDTVDTTTVGTYVVTYDANDGYNDAIQVTRTVTVSDTTPPVINVAVPPNCEADDMGGTVNCDFPATSPEGAYVDLSGIVTATDLGQPIDVSCSTVPPSTLVGATLPTTLLPGDYTVLCRASDGSTVEVTVQISVDVVDEQPPVLLVPTAAVTVVADPLTGTAVVNYAGQVSATDLVDSNVEITCEPPSGSTFAAGTTTVTCTASDDGPNADGGVNTATATFDVIVTDETGPVVTAPDVALSRDYYDPLDPDWARILPSEYVSGVSASDIVDGPISSVSCERDDDPAPLSDEDFEFSDTPYSITCTAVDAAGNDGSTSFALTVSYLYDIELVPPKGRARAGSTVPLDWSYFDEFGVVNSSDVAVRVEWTKMTDQSCSTPAPDLGSNGVSGLGDDSGNSDFRYSASNDAWQFSWQTPDLPGYYKVDVSPPGANVETAWACINLR